MKNYFKSITVILLFSTLTVSSQESIEDTLQIDDVVVTTAKTEVNRDNVPMSVSLISGKQIESSSESNLLPVLGEYSPGVFVTERGVSGFGVSSGAAGQINIRGIGGSPNTQTLILLNGNPQFMGIMGHPLPDAYVASDVQKVEIIRGPGSALYGTNAMGGVINIITKEQTADGYNVNGRIMYGSYNTLKGMVNTGYKKDKFRAFVSFNHDNTDGHRAFSDFRINNGYANISYEINKHLKAEAFASIADFLSSDPGMESLKAGETIDILRGVASLGLSNKFEKTKGSVSVFNNFGEHNITDGFHSKDKCNGITAYQNFNLIKNNVFTVGVDVKQFGGMAENTKAMKGKGIQICDTVQWESAGYLTMQHELFKKLTLNGSIRAEYNSNYGVIPIPYFGFAYKFIKNTVFKASYSKGFRSPTIRELYLWAPANPDLKPEKMNSFEASLHRSFIDNKLRFELTGFYLEADNIIQTQMTDGGPKNTNSGSFSNKGVEFLTNYNISKSFNAHLNYTYTNTENPILACPRNQLNVSLTYNLKKIAATVSTQYVEKLYLTTVAPLSSQNYLLLNARLSYKANKYLNIFVKGENLSNQKYYINNGYPMPGIMGFAGLNFNLK